MEPVLVLKDILLTQGENFRLTVGSLELHSQQIYALTGPNGAGKSSLLRVMALLTKARTGTVRFSGHAATHPSRQRQMVTLVAQSPYLFKGSVAENLSYGLKLRGIPRAEQLRRITLTLSIVGLEGFEQRKAKELSSGEVQRVALARALVFKPALLLLDEPTANIDSRSLPAFEALLGRLPKYGMTVVFSTHDLFQAERLGGTMLRIEEGRLHNLPSRGATCPVTEERRDMHG